MTFEQYMEQQIPNYSDVLSTDIITELQELYDQKEFFLNAASHCLFQQGTSNIDYTTDYEKNMMHATKYGALLEQQITKIHISLETAEHKSR